MIWHIPYLGVEISVLQIYINANLDAPVIYNVYQLNLLNGFNYWIISCLQSYSIFIVNKEFFFPY